MWKVICGYDVFVEYGQIVRAMKNRCTLPASVYKWNNRLDCWVNACPCSVSAFRSGIRRGTYAVM